MNISPVLSQNAIYSSSSVAQLPSAKSSSTAQAPDTVELSAAAKAHLAAGRDVDGDHDGR